MIPFIKYKEKETKLSLSFDTLIYNGKTTKVPKTTIEYEWELNKNGTIKELEQSVKIQKETKVQVKYQKEKNVTKIEEEKTHITKAGIVSISVVTNNGVIEVMY